MEQMQRNRVASGTVAFERTIQRTMIADYKVGMTTTSLVPDCNALNPNVEEKPQPVRNRQVIGSSPIVGSISSITWR